MNRFLQLCVDGKTLTAGEAETLMNMMMAAEMTPSEMGGILSILAHRGETPEELAGFVKAMRAHALTVDGLPDIVDTCGTGETVFPLLISQRPRQLLPRQLARKSLSMAIALSLLKAEALMF